MTPKNIENNSKEESVMADNLPEENKPGMLYELDRPDKPSHNKRLNP